MAEAGFDRVAIAEGLAGDLEAMDTAEVSAPAPEKAAPAVIDTDSQQETPAPAATTPEAKTFADNDLVIDPADGQAKKWGEIKSERLRQADYTKKTMALAEERRRVAEMEANLAAKAAQAEIQAKMAQLPELPEDDPYAQHQRALREQVDAIAKYQATMHQQMQEQMQERELQSSRIALDAKEKQLVAEHGLSARELELVEREYYHRANSGEQITLDDVAREHAGYVAELKAAAVKEFKEKHRVSVPAASVSTPGAGAKEETMVPGSRGFRDRMREEIAALMS